MNLYFLLALVVIAFGNFALGYFVYKKAGNRYAAKSFFGFTACISWWSICLALANLAKTAEQALFWIQMIMVGAIFIPYVVQHFMDSFCKSYQRLGILRSFLHIGSIGLLEILNFTPWMFKSAEVRTYGVHFVPGLAYWFYAVYFGGIIGYSLCQLLKHWRKSGGEESQRILYVLIALTIAFAFGIIADILLPLFGVTQLNRFGPIGTVAMGGLMAYAITKHQLMDIHIVIRRALLSLFWVALSVIFYMTCIAYFAKQNVMALSNFSVLTAALSFIMAAFVLVKGFTKNINMLWALTCLAIGFWSLGYGMMVHALVLSQAMFWQTWFLYMGAIMIAVLFLHFVSLLVQIKIKPVLSIGYAVAILFEYINVVGRLATVEPKPPFPFYTVAHYPYYQFFTLFFFTSVLYAQWLLFSGMRSSAGALKNQIKYVLLGTSVGFIGGMTTFFLSYNIHLFPLGVYVVPFYLMTVTYAIYKHRLLDISVVLRQGVIYSLMTAFLTVVYVVVITKSAKYFEDMMGGSKLLYPILAASLVTIAFQPLQRRIQSFVDRHFFPGWKDREMAREIAAGFSHELKSPLALLSLQAQSALAEVREVQLKGRPTREALGKIEADLERLVKQTMEAAKRIEAVRGVAEPAGDQVEAVEIQATVENSLQGLHVLIGTSNTHVSCELPAKLPAVRSNPKQLDIVFTNLLKNALEAMRNSSKRRLSIRGSENKGSVFVSIRDTGPGIKPEHHERLFQAYFTTKGSRGTGMGLYLSRQIVEAHGGAIEVSSEEGKGTEFVVRLPTFDRSGVS